LKQEENSNFQTDDFNQKFFKLEPRQTKFNKQLMLSHDNLIDDVSPTILVRRKLYKLLSLIFGVHLPHNLSTWKKLVRYHRLAGQVQSDQRRSIAVEIRLSLLPS
jgi:hypothetical protein